MKSVLGSRWTAALVTVVAAVVLSVAAARANLPPGQEVNQLEACGQCHDLEDALSAPVRHEPAASGDCSSCHNPHVSRFEKLLRERPGPLCLECHGDVQAELERPVVHPPVAEGQCASCHEPHGGQHRGLLVAAGADLCVQCHQEVETWRERPVRHVPFAQGRCDACHEPHAGNAPGLLTQEGGASCTQCHAMDAGLRAAHQGYPVERAACQQCHDPHASSRPGLFRQALHAPFEGGDCTTCHPGPNAPDPFATVAPLDRLCGECHEDQVTASREARFPHVSAGGGACVACHNPHTGDGDGLLKADETSLCISCHDPGGARSGQTGRHLTHGDGLSCSTCHAPHGGEQPVLLAKDSIELCGDCHTHQHGVTHPLGEETRDPRNGDPMTCRSCHGLHDAPYEFYLHRSSDHELCISCHKDFVRGR